jgi:adenylate cyclase
LSDKNLVATVAIVVVGTLSVWLSGVALVARALHRTDPAPETAAPRKPPNITKRQSAILLMPWVAAAVVVIPLNIDAGIRVLVLIASAVMFGATATVCTGFLFTQRPLRALMIAATVDLEHAEKAPGVRARLILMWTVCTALPGAGIVVLVMLAANGWIIQDNAPIEVPILVLALVAVVLGLRAMILVSSSISDPVHEVVDAMAQVERGRLGTVVDVYERSELGQLQSGFNRMVTGLQERDRLRDLFGRHVGTEVVRRAIGEIESLSGDEREAAILFIDLVGSTQLAATREPHEVAKVLNDFFRIVVAQVDQRDGLVNKFQGDAVLAVFGAPLRIDNQASAALATARALGAELRRLPFDFGIGVSAGPIFAGNIGAENRYEYTVVGDAVNEAARLADRAKESDRRVLCSGAAIDRADASERKCWVSQGSEVLRGRSSPTHISAPAGASQ